MVTADMRPANSKSVQESKTLFTLSDKRKRELSSRHWFRIGFINKEKHESAVNQECR